MCLLIFILIYIQVGFGFPHQALKPDELFRDLKSENRRGIAINYEREKSSHFGGYGHVIVLILTKIVSDQQITHC